MYSKIVNFLKNNFPKYLSVYYKLRFVLRATYLKEPRAHLLWILKRGDKTAHKKFTLDSDSIFFDVGSFEGNYTDKIIDEFDCFSYLFEPHPFYVKKLEEKFNSNSKVKIFNYGLGGKTENIFLTDDTASSKATMHNTGLKAQVKDIIEVMNELKIKKINLLKLNIEGSEYDLLENLVESNEIKKINTLKIQFHENVNNYDFRRNKIREKLQETHKEIWSYYMVWERWDLIE
jgi:FkbM family methyltransferase